MIDYNEFLRGLPMKSKNRFTLTHFFKSNQQLVKLKKRKFGLEEDE
jgi:hypothetical protein